MTELMWCVTAEFLEKEGDVEVLEKFPNGYWEVRRRSRRRRNRYEEETPQAEDYYSGW